MREQKYEILWKTCLFPTNGFHRIIVSRHRPTSCRHTNAQSGSGIKEPRGRLHAAKQNKHPAACFRQGYKNVSRRFCKPIRSARACRFLASALFAIVARESFAIVAREPLPSWQGSLCHRGKGAFAIVAKNDCVIQS